MMATTDVLVGSLIVSFKAVQSSPRVAHSIELLSVAYQTGDIVSMYTLALLIATLDLDSHGEGRISIQKKVGAQKEQI